MFQGIRRGFGCAIRSMNQRGSTCPADRRFALFPPGPPVLSCSRRILPGPSPVSLRVEQGGKHRKCFPPLSMGSIWLPAPSKSLVACTCAFPRMAMLPSSRYQCPQAPRRAGRPGAAAQAGPAPALCPEGVEGYGAERQGPQGDKGAGSRAGTVCLRRGRTAAASGAHRGTRAYARSESAASATASAVKPNSRNSVA